MESQLNHFYMIQNTLIYVDSIKLEIYNRVHNLFQI